MKRVVNRIKKEYREVVVLLRNLPALALTVFVVSIVLMNLLASKALVNNEWIALDAGYLVSWVSFLMMDMIVKRYGAKASITVSIVAALINIAVMLIFLIAALIPGDWALNEYSTSVSWWIIGASTAAFIVSGVVNSLTNYAIKKLFKDNPHSFKAYAASSYGSTMIGQFVDNLVFALVFTYPASCVGLWGMQKMTLLALFMFAFSGAIGELVSQMIFSPLGYKVAENWRKTGVGDEYLRYMEEHK